MLRNLADADDKHRRRSRRVLEEREIFSIVANYAVRALRDKTRSTERADVPLTPRHSVGLDAAWELGDAWRLGVEWYYTGRQRLEANPLPRRSAPLLACSASWPVVALGRALLFINGENLTDVKQTDWDPLLRAVTRRRWPVDSRRVGALGGRDPRWYANHVLRSETTAPYRFLESL